MTREMVDVLGWKYQVIEGLMMRTDELGRKDEGRES